MYTRHGRWHRLVLNRDPLSYIFSCIHLLSDIPGGAHPNITLPARDALPVSETPPGCPAV